MFPCIDLIVYFLVFKTSVLFSLQKLVICQMYDSKDFSPTPFLYSADGFTWCAEAFSFSAISFCPLLISLELLESPLGNPYPRPCLEMLPFSHWGISFLSLWSLNWFLYKEGYRNLISFFYIAYLAFSEPFVDKPVFSQCISLVPLLEAGWL